ncbi:hypothetical protein ACIBTV_27285 [Micromonospora sp. NPDC049366]
MTVRVRMVRLLLDLICLVVGHRLAAGLGRGCVPGCWYCTRCGRGDHAT